MNYVVQSIGNIYTHNSLAVQLTICNWLYNTGIIT